MSASKGWGALNPKTRELTLIPPGSAVRPLNLYPLRAADVANLGFTTEDENGHPSLPGFNRCQNRTLDSLRPSTTWTLYRREGSDDISIELQAEAAGILGYHTDLSSILRFYKAKTRGRSEVRGETGPAREEEIPKLPKDEDSAVSAVSEGEAEDQQPASNTQSSYSLIVFGDDPHSEEAEYIFVLDPSSVKSAEL